MESEQLMYFNNKRNNSGYKQDHQQQHFTFVRNPLTVFTGTPLTGSSIFCTTFSILAYIRWFGWTARSPSAPAFALGIAILPKCYFNITIAQAILIKITKIKMFSSRFHKTEPMVFNKRRWNSNKTLYPSKILDDFNKHQKTINWAPCQYQLVRKKGGS